MKNYNLQFFSNIKQNEEPISKCPIYCPFSILSPIFTVATQLDTSAIEIAIKITLPMLGLSDLIIIICLVATQLKNGCCNSNSVRFGFSVPGFNKKKKPGTV